MITRRFAMGLALIASVYLPVPVYFAQSVPSVAPLDTGPMAAITFANAKSLKTKSKSDRFGVVGVNAGETVKVDLEFSPTLATSLIVIQALDGGIVPATDQEKSVGVDGKASMRFQVGVEPGLYRVLINAGGETSTLQFWVADPTNPAANPPVLKP